MGNWVLFAVDELANNMNKYLSLNYIVVWFIVECLEWQCVVFCVLLIFDTHYLKMSAEYSDQTLHFELITHLSYSCYLKADKIPTTLSAPRQRIAAFISNARQ
jgi:hypothetical protein